MTPRPDPIAIELDGETTWWRSPGDIRAGDEVFNADGSVYATRVDWTANRYLVSLVRVPAPKQKKWRRTATWDDLVTVGTTTNEELAAYWKRNNRDRPDRYGPVEEVEE